MSSNLVNTVYPGSDLTAAQELKCEQDSWLTTVEVEQISLCSSSHTIPFYM